MENLTVTTVRVKRLGEPCRLFDAAFDRGLSFNTGDVHDVSLSLGRELLRDPAGWEEVFDGGLVTHTVHRQE